ncbi:MAG: glycoside hydrolase family 43 protein [Lachnospiraceae bacterium]|nr:glycoside hydrolase family 43 protein [Lachnospiraceae bacterium]
MKFGLVPLLVAAAMFLGGCGMAAVKKMDLYRGDMSESEIVEKSGGFTAGASVHDPSIYVENGKYYIFGTHMAVAESTDLRNWTQLFEGVDEKNKLFSNLLNGDLGAFSFVGRNQENGYSVWAPDVIFNKAMNKYVMYFCTTSTYKKSSLCYAAADKVTGPYKFIDRILDSGFNNRTVYNTDFLDYHDKSELNDYLKDNDYDNQKWPNCIDPCVFNDKEGKMWMVYGSWSGGIFLLQLDENTGLPIHPEENKAENTDAYYGKHLIGGGHNSIEGPYILYDKVSDYYYLFVSYGELNAKGGYQIRLYRSRQVDGPYVDMNNNSPGKVIDHSKFGLKMIGNYTFPSLSYTYMAPGHNSAFCDLDGKMYMVYHQRFKNGTEAHEPRVHQLFRNEDDWLVAAPFAVSGESLKSDGYAQEAISGMYYLVAHGTDISRKVHECEKVKVAADGTMEGDREGALIVKANSPYATMFINEKEFKGVMLEMKDEAGNDCMCFTGAAENETVWAVQYYK